MIEDVDDEEDGQKKKLVEVRESAVLSRRGAYVVERIKSPAAE